MFVTSQGQETVTAVYCEQLTIHRTVPPKYIIQPKMSIMPRLRKLDVNNGFGCGHRSFK